MRRVPFAAAWSLLVMAAACSSFQAVEAPADAGIDTGTSVPPSDDSGPPADAGPPPFSCDGVGAEDFCTTFDSLTSQLTPAFVSDGGSSYWLVDAATSPPSAAYVRSNGSFPASLTLDGLRPDVKHFACDMQVAVTKVSDPTDLVQMVNGNYVYAIQASYSGSAVAFQLVALANDGKAHAVPLGSAGLETYIAMHLEYDGTNGMVLGKAVTMGTLTGLKIGGGPPTQVRFGPENLASHTAAGMRIDDVVCRYLP